MLQDHRLVLWHVGTVMRPEIVVEVVRTRVMQQRLAAGVSSYIIRMMARSRSGTCLDY
jgi:hypothetical protein